MFVHVRNYEIWSLILCIFIVCTRDFLAIFVEDWLGFVTIEYLGCSSIINEGIAVVFTLGFDYAHQTRNTLFVLALDYGMMVLILCQSKESFGPCLGCFIG